MKKLTKRQRLNRREATEDHVRELWVLALLGARAQGGVGHNVIKDLLVQSKKILKGARFDHRATGAFLFGIYSEIHWDFPEPTDRLFEAALDRELEEFFSERLPQ
jgi:hypothetical protein